MNKKHLLLLAMLFFLYACKEKSLPSTIGDMGLQIQNHFPERPTSISLFQEIPAEHSHITIKNRIVENDELNYFSYEYLYNGGGVAVGDLNNDGLPDLIFTLNMAPNRIFLNKGNLEFEDITKNSGFASQLDWATGITLADVNADGFLDIYVCRSGWFDDPKQRRNLLYINQGNLTFKEQAATLGVDDSGYSTQATFFDYDRDGDLDLYVANHSNIFKEELNKALEKKKNPPPANSGQLYRNEGSRFLRVSREAGIESYGHSLGVIASDLNNDGWVDLYVSNDYQEPDYFYRNNGDGTFTDIISSAMGHIAKFSMGVDAADFNNDGQTDIFTVEMMAADRKRQKTNMASMNPELFQTFVDHGFGYQYMHNCLQLNHGNSSFSDIAYLAGVAQTDWSWAPLFADFDNDGWKDIFISNGYRKDVLDKDFKNKFKSKILAEGTVVYSEIENLLPVSVVPNFLYRNNGALSFREMSAEWGLSTPVNTNGAAYADLDADGDLDLVLNCMEAPCRIIQNLSIEKNTANSHFLQIAFKGPEKNKNALGTKVELWSEGQKQHQELTLTRGFQSSVEPMLHFGLANRTTIDKVRVIWPDGTQTELTKVAADQKLIISYEKTSASGNHKGPEKWASAVFKATQIPGLDQALHREKNFDDYQKQLLLPHKASQNGPGIAVGDVNGDGLDDCYIGGAAGQPGSLYFQDSKGAFFQKNITAFQQDQASEDMGSLLFDADQDGDLDLYVVSGSSEFVEGSAHFQDRLYYNDGQGKFSRAIDALPINKASGSCVLAADYDDDGDLDLFVGGRIVPGRYPEPASSQLLRNEKGKFVEVAGDIAPGLEHIGMVTAALWTDYDLDDDLDLILAGEWMPISVFQNQEGHFSEQTKALGLENTRGWWNSIAAGDFDADGDVDYVLGNLGWNSKNKTSADQPFCIYAKDFDQNGSLDVALGFSEQGLYYPVRGRQCSSEQVAFIADQIPTYQEFGAATLEQVYGKEKLQDALFYKSHTFASSLLFNNGGTGFDLRALPPEAQIAPTCGLLCEDFDGDQILDIIGIGNQFPVEVETGRYDAHRGFFLKGTANGEFIAIPPSKSGWWIEGDAKALTLIAIGTAKKPCLIATRNNNYPLAFNLTKAASIVNEAALEKLKHKKRETYLGSGYLSQSSPGYLIIDEVLYN